MSNTTSHASSIIETVDIATEISKHVKLKPHNQELVGLCPFHSEDTPSFYVNPVKRLYFCFGCQSGGNIITFRAQISGINNADAIEALAKDYNISLTGKPQVSKSFYDLVQQSKEYYQQQLHLNNSASLYLKERGISQESINTFMIGYAPKEWRSLSKSSWFNETDGKKIGLMVETDKGGYDRFRHRIMFPIISHQGKYVGFGGRALGDDKPKYINSSESPIYHKSHILYGLYHALKDKQKQLIVVEGYLDVISLHQSGFRGAVAALGTAFTSSHFNLVSQYAEEVIFCFDGDEAGNKAALKSFHVLLPLVRDQVSIRFLKLPHGEDPDSFIQKNGASHFKKLLEAAVPFSEFLFSLHAPKNSSLEEVAKSKSHIAELIAQMPDSILKKLLIDKAGLQSINTPPPLIQPPKHKNNHAADIDTIELLFAFPTLLAKHAPTIAATIKLLPKGVQQAITFIQNHPGSSLATFVTAYNIEIRYTYKPAELNEEQADIELQKHLLHHQLIAIEQKIQKLMTEIAKGNKDLKLAETLQQLLKAKHQLKKKKIILASS
ncbi:MAG: DNA primase [Pseudomonadota bacterium]|nr:DNA primase [Pseudomonadota bacterium]